MQRLTPTRLLAVKVCWALAWRTFLATLVVGIALGIVFGLLGAALKLPQESMLKFANAVGYLVGAAAAVEVMYYILRKPLRGFRLIAVPADDGGPAHG